MKDLNTGFLHRYTSKSVMKKLLVNYKTSLIDGGSVSMLNLILEIFLKLLIVEFYFIAII